MINSVISMGMADATVIMVEFRRLSDFFAQRLSSAYNLTENVSIPFRENAEIEPSLKAKLRPTVTAALVSIKNTPMVVETVME